MTVLDNPTHFTNPFQFEITFECLEPLNDGAPPPSLASMPGPGGRPALPHSHPDALGADLEWKLIYVGSAYDQQKDQVGPAPAPRQPRAQLTDPLLPCAHRSWSRSSLVPSRSA